jgi:hypothetical protein
MAVDESREDSQFAEVMDVVSRRDLIWGAQAVYSAFAFEYC